MFEYSEQPIDTRSRYSRSISVRYNGKFIGRLCEIYDTKRWQAYLRLAWPGSVFDTFEQAQTAQQEAYLRLQKQEEGA